VDIEDRYLDPRQGVTISYTLTDDEDWTIRIKGTKSQVEEWLEIYNPNRKDIYNPISLYDYFKQALETVREWRKLD